MRNLRVNCSIIRFTLLAASLLLAGCGGGGGGGGSANDDAASTISINTPTSLGRYETFEERIDLGGSSAVPEGADCSAPIVRNISGINIRWRNSANNASGWGTSSLWCIGFVAATWHIRSIPLVIGKNQIQVSGTGGSDSIVVERLRDEKAPTRRLNHTAVWNGTEMIIWGGQSYYGPTALANGAAYNPVTDTWRSLSSIDAPAARFDHTAVWTGSEMIVWGGADSVYPSDAAAYDPSADSWRPVTRTDSPSATAGHGAVWTGSEMIVWKSGLASRAGRYDPAADAWSPMSELCAPPSGDDSHAIWTGTQMIVWGGAQGSLYDPATDAWQPMTSFNAPGDRYDYVSVWTGSELIVWGGGIPFTGNLLGTGAMYRP